MTENIKVNLWDMIGVNLILLEDSTVKYFNQVGGTACLDKSEIGILVPYNNDFPEDQFQKSFEYYLSKIFSDYQSIHLDSDILEKLNSFFKENSQLGLLSVDEERISESCESWIYVNIESGLDSVINGIVSKAVLTWPNGD